MNNLVNVTIALSDKMGLSILLRRYLFRKQIHNSRISHKSIVLNFFNYPDFDLLISFTRNKFFETFHHLRAKFTDVVLRNFDFSANYDSSTPNRTCSAFGRKFRRLFRIPMNAKCFHKQVAKNLVWKAQSVRAV